MANTAKKVVATPMVKAVTFIIVAKITLFLKIVGKQCMLISDKRCVKKTNVRQFDKKCHYGVRSSENGLSVLNKNGKFGKGIKSQHQILTATICATLF